LSARRSAAVKAGGRGAAGADPARRALAIELLRELSEADGIPAHEDEVRAIFRRRLGAGGTPGLTMRQDGLGSVLAELRGASDRPRVMIDCHMDEVGLIVHSITSRGFIKFLPVGGWWGHVLLSQRVRIQTSAGKVSGIVGSKPPHFLEAEERRRVIEPHDMFIDVGARSREEATRMGIEVGSPIAPDTRFAPLADPDLVSGKAFDNRAGCAVLIQAMLELVAGRAKPPCTVIGVASVQEEVGLRGAVTSSAVAKPDLAIVLEGSPADDTPGLDPESAQSVLGQGAQLRVMDTSMVSHRGFRRFAQEVAREARIPLQIAVRRSGGTDGGSIHKSGEGVPTIALAVPVRYIHSHVAVLDVKDYLTTLRLVLAIIAKCDRRGWETITR